MSRFITPRSFYILSMSELSYGFRLDKRPLDSDILNVQIFFKEVRVMRKYVIIVIAALLTLMAACNPSLPDVDPYEPSTAEPSQAVTPDDNRPPSWGSGNGVRPGNGGQGNQINQDGEIAITGYASVAETKDSLVGLIEGEYFRSDLGTSIIDAVRVDGGYIEIESFPDGVVMGFRCFVPYELFTVAESEEEEDELAPGIQSMFDFAAIKTGRPLTDDEADSLLTGARAARTRPEPVVIEINGASLYLSYFDGEVCLQ